MDDLGQTRNLAQRSDGAAKVWISAGAIRSHMIALVHAITTQPVAITPHQVIKVIATPIGPNPVHPRSNIGKPTRITAVRTIPSITTPAKPASRWYFHLDHRLAR